MMKRLSICRYKRGLSINWRRPERSHVKILTKYRFAKKDLKKWVGGSKFRVISTNLAKCEMGDAHRKISKLTW